MDIGFIKKQYVRPANAHRYRRWFCPLAAAVLFLSVLIPVLCWRFDNKYTRPRPQAGNGVIDLNMDWYDRHPFFYLVDGWEYYQGHLLTPFNIKDYEPDASLYLGRFGGFDLGDPDADPHGCATYRIVILTDSIERDYALELTEIYSRWNLWINGTLVQSVGMADSLETAQLTASSPAPDSRLVTFRARDRIEIITAVADDSHFYSGMVYPPAFGSPKQVGRVSSARLFIHAGAIVVATFIAVFCLFWGSVTHFQRPYGALALLCLFFAGSTSWPVFSAFGMSGDFWPVAERFCYYGIFLGVIWLHSRICSLPPKVALPACAAGLLVEMSILIQPLIPVTRAIDYYHYSQMLSMYKWTTSLWLIATGIWALLQGRRYAGVLLIGSSMLAGALIVGKLLPAHEPVLFGWPVEIAGGAIIFLAASILLYDTMRLQLESRELQAKQEIADIQLRARASQALLQQEYVRRTREQLHESRHRLTLIRHYLDTGNYDRLSDYVKELTGTMTNQGSREYTGNSLIDALLSTQLTDADRMGIYTELDLDRLPEHLDIEDDDLTILIMNLLDNAKEACCRLSDESERWISLRLTLREKTLHIHCSNAALPPSQKPEITSKEDQNAHGFGLAKIQEAARRYHGSLKTSRTDDSYEILVTLILRHVQDGGSSQ